MRYEQDVQLRRAAALEVQLDTLAERVFQQANHGGARSRGERTRGRNSLKRAKTPPVNGAVTDDLRLI